RRTPMTCSSVKRFFTSNLLGGRELDSKLGCYSKSGGRRLYEVVDGKIQRASFATGARIDTAPAR
ncbi:hypothetical protein ACUY3Q_03035, partial [Xanthomonas arboricola pv. corylina]